ncbi:FAD-dependent monooxygenase [Arenibacterium sp. CAU 1754]
MTLKDRDITILGGGIGGMSAACALADHGARVRVLEQAPALTEVGAGLQISQNGMVVLRKLGVVADVPIGAVQSDGVELRDFRNGRPVFDLPPPLAGPTWFFHRADLLAQLVHAAGVKGVEIELGRRARSITLSDGHATIAFEDGTHEDASCLIGADGVRGVSRQTVEGAGDPLFSGQVAWRAIVPRTAPADRAPAVVTMGPGRHVVTYPLRDKTLMNVVAVEERRDWTNDSWSCEADPRDLRARFADFGGAVGDILSEVTQAHQWALYLHPVARRWFDGPLALLGDAAHPTLPFMAQGACMAIEDAWVLATSLAQQDAVGAGFAHYRDLRRPRTERVVAAAAKNAHRFHLRSPFRQVAQLGLSVAGRVAAPTYDWIYDFDVTA